ncbi:hypothetical protein PIB30_079030 [Stylosanthes scabra]|uniref:Uncharacterized protein n=1 Tax=Stylosanthes scabra TaxID=79078 RepID=A0ABU6VQV9_9FABA|nr:hypothetical protein [Stylosanthes scabra]
MKDKKDGFQKKNPKKNALSESESESEYEESYSSDESYSGLDSEETRSVELIQRKQNTKPNLARDEKSSKKKHEINATEEMHEGNEPLHLSQLLTQGFIAEVHQNEEHTLAEAVKGINKSKQQEKEERNNKKAKNPNEEALIGPSEHEQNAIMLGSATVSLGTDDSGNLNVDGSPITASQPSIHPMPEPPQQPAPQEEQPPQQPPHLEEHPSQQPHPEEEIIDISSSSKDEHEPIPSRVFFPLVPKAEEEQPHQEVHPPQPQHPQDEKNPFADEEKHLEAEGRPVQTQSAVEVIPIYPTQEVIDISSSSNDEPEPTPIKVSIPKAEVDHVSSPHAKTITEVLLSMSQEHPTQSEPDGDPSFDLGIDYEI